MKERASRLTASKNLVKIKLDDNSYILYNSLLGFPMKVNYDVLRLVRSIGHGIDASSHYYGKRGQHVYRDTVTELKKRFFLVDENLDERSFLKKDDTKLKDNIKSGKFIETLRLEMAACCNFKCHHCYYPKAYGWEKKRCMSFTTAKRAIDGMVPFLQKGGRKDLRVTFFGGEPLLNWATLKKTVEYGTALEAQHGLRFRPGLITNGILLNDNVVHFLKKHSVAALVSLDGLEQENDRFRVFPDGRGTFRYIIKGIDKLAKHGIEFGIELCINDYNFLTLEKVVDFIVDRYGGRCSSFVVTPVTTQLPRSGFDHLSGKEKAKRTISLMDYCRKAGIAFGGSWGSVAMGMSEDNRYYSRNCKGLYNSLYVRSSGLVHPCHHITSVIGHVRAMNKIPQNENYIRTAMRTVDKITSCKGCAIEGICAGGCAGIAQFYSGDIYDTGNPLFRHFYCDYMRNVFQELLKYLAARREMNKDLSLLSRC